MTDKKVSSNKLPINTEIRVEFDPIFIQLANLDQIQLAARAHVTWANILESRHTDLPHLGWP